MRPLFCSLLLLAGCYDPKPPSGSYLCGAGDACPSHLTCECGQCVTDKDDAACSFTIAATSAVDGALSVEEHEQFSVAVQALNARGTPALHFGGTATLSSTWGDVCVGTGGCTTSPDEVTLSGGTGMATIQLNRETNPPLSAIVRASFGSNVGTSMEKITVHRAKATRAPLPLVLPATPQAPFGFATSSIGAPYVVKDANGWSMYFVGGHDRTLAGFTLGAGVATSTNGMDFVSPVKLFDDSLADASTQFGAVSAYVHGGRTTLFGARGAISADFASAFVGFRTIVRADVADAASFGTTPLFEVSKSGCDECVAFDSPMVIPDPNPGLTGGGVDSQVMFFAAAQMTDTGFELAVRRATAPDGKTFTVEPGAALENTFAETALLSPRILVDGTTYKMWYSFAKIPSVSSGTTGAATVSPCNPLVHYQVGYATSSDGYYWVRSSTNSNRPTLKTSVATDLFEHGGSVLLGSVIATDGNDPSNGISLYYSPMTLVGTSCVPNGVGVATTGKGS